MIPVRLIVNLKFIVFSLSITFKVKSLKLDGIFVIFLPGASRKEGAAAKNKSKNDVAPPPPPPGVFDKRPASIYPPAPHRDNNNEKVSAFNLLVKDTL